MQLHRISRAVVSPSVQNAFFSTKNTKVSGFFNLSGAFTAQIQGAKNFVKGTLLNTLTERMPRKEAAILAEKWGYLIQQIPTRDDNCTNASALGETVSSAASSEVPPNMLDTMASHQYQDWTSYLPTADTAYVDKELLHPVFGELVCDLTYKKTYLSDIRSLAKANVWEKQRILRPARAAQIAREKSKAMNEDAREMVTPVLSGVITMYQDASTGKSGIIDGQHRVAALVLLAKDGKWPLYKKNILVDVIQTRSSDEISALFAEINSAEPIRLVDMPSNSAIEERRKMVLDHAVNDIENKFPKMFKNSARCRKPHVNADKLRDDLWQSGIFTRKANIRTSKQLTAYMLRMNKRLSFYDDTDWMQLLGFQSIKMQKSPENTTVGTTDSDEEFSDASENDVIISKNPFYDDQQFKVALEKAKMHGFYLGLTNRWMGA